MIDISIIMPALNEERNIAAALERTLRSFETFKLKGEIIVVDDGSSDRTGEIAEDKMGGGSGEGIIRILKHEKPRGIGASFRDGAGQSRGFAVTMIPGDNENDPAEILKYYPLLKNVDMVVPFVSNIQVRPKFRNMLSALYRLIVNVTFGVNFKYTNGTVLYRRDILSANRSDGFFFQTENVVRAAKRGCRYAEVPYRLDERKGGVSKAISLTSFKQVVKDYLKLVKEIYFK